MGFAITVSRLILAEREMEGRRGNIIKRYFFNTILPSFSSSSFCRMSACGAHNLELQRKIQQLEETNNALLEQLSRLQALLPNGPGKTRQKATCILVLLLSFSLLISSNLRPDPYSQLSQADYAETKVPSRSLQSMDDARDIPPPPPPSLPLPLLCVTRGFEALRNLTEKIRPWTDLPKADVPFSRHQDHRHKDLH
ncbi:cyclic AMP-responsive element-binding protein 3-like protein 3-A [Pundamilia nyererei]|uniref:Cyclic AMP-responsive element-binding protein 3-like protein 3-A n=1 Tax=Pundamilia nyererei TaxID=303518 RepID=A0A9Y3QQM3_9CICH|nr:PREDICTED: cyclic AMP-responsive element-binding protein 3-like protein 3 [Pundamilia nyererei]